MKKYYFSREISKKMNNINKIPEWIKNMPDYAEQIKIIREIYGLSQEELGRLIKSNGRVIRRIENKEVQPTMSLLLRIAEALNTKLYINLIPKETIEKYLKEKALKKAKEIVMQAKSSASLEKQTPSVKSINEEIHKIADEIFNQKRDMLWKRN
ncbi:multiprotein-bridging factor 1 family protein [Candidatus Margulisiibacteriota bacterium]